MSEWLASKKKKNPNKPNMPWPGGSVGYCIINTLKGCGFDPWSGHTPRLKFDPQSGLVQEATDQCFSLTSMFLSLPLHLPLFLNSLPKSINICLGEDSKTSTSKSGKDVEKPEPSTLMVGR